MGAFAPSHRTITGPRQRLRELDHANRLAIQQEKPMHSIKYGPLAEQVTALAAVLMEGWRLPCRLTSFMRTWTLVALLLCAAAGAPVLAAERGPVRSLLEMRQDRVVVQKWDSSCGAAALATVLSYQHGDPVSEGAIASALIQRQEYLANPLRVQEGFSLLDLKRYVNKRGYEGIGYARLTPQDLIERAPIIVPLNLHGYNHFVVFRGRRGDRVLLADPAWGNRTMRAERFEDAWIDYPRFGRIGFVVAGRDGIMPPNRLAPRASDFLILR